MKNYHDVILDTLSNEDYQELWDNEPRSPRVAETALLRGMVLRLPDLERGVYERCIMGGASQESCGEELGIAQTKVHAILQRITEYLQFYVEYQERKSAFVEVGHPLFHRVHSLNSTKNQKKSREVIRLFLEYPDVYTVARKIRLSYDRTLYYINHCRMQDIKEHLAFLKSAPHLFKKSVRLWE